MYALSEVIAGRPGSRRYQRNMLYAAQRYSEDNGALAEVNYVDLGPSSGWPTPPA
jgi:hypothetical protein